MGRTFTIPVKKRRRDWFRIVRDLAKYGGLSMADIATKCGRDKSTVENWTEGGEPKDSDAQIVLALYAIFCPVQYEEHVREFNIGRRVQEVTGEGENHALPFVQE